MRVLHSWLQSYGRFSIRPRDLADRLGMLGLEVEGMEEPGKRYEGFVVGKVLEVTKHSKADRLSVCMVNIGRETVQIVCGAPNVAAGQYVAVGLPGATVPRNQHDPEGTPFVLGKATIRGVESSGMICSEYELDLGRDADGIMVLGNDSAPGTSLADHFGLNDTAYDVEVTPNRPDWLSHFGVAREIGALTGRTPKLPAIHLRESRTPARKVLGVSIEDRTNCLRFGARVIRGVTVGPSPLWLQNRLRNVGLRPRNAIVDITNVVMLECGQPMHAFDLNLLRGARIIVRQTAAETPFQTLDGADHRLPAGTVMVCDAVGEVSIAGIMGGANSEIRETTTDVVLESACWHPTAIRRTSKFLGLSTDASQRFERGADIGMVPWALDRAADLIARFAGGEVLQGMIDVYPRKHRQKAVPLRVSRTNDLLGTSLKRADIVRLLARIGIRSGGSGKGTLKCVVPSFRVDIAREVDLIEEVARVHGYNNIESKRTARISFDHPYAGAVASDRMRTAAIGNGFQECISYPLQETGKAELAGVQPVAVLNPQNREMAALRTSLLPGLLDAVQRNINFGNPDLRLFEVGRVFCVDHSPHPKPVGTYREEERVALLLSGLARKKGWNEVERGYDIFDMKGEVIAFLTRLGLDKAWAFSYSTTNSLTEETVAIDIHGAYAGYFGTVSRKILKPFGIEQRVFFAECVVGKLPSSEERKYHALPRYPGVKRDVAFSVDAGVSSASVEQTIRAASSGLLRTVRLFDLFSGGSVSAGRKSLAFSLSLQSEERTLTEKEIEEEVHRVVRAVENAFGATLRSE